MGLLGEGQGSAFKLLALPPRTRTWSILHVSAVPSFLHGARQPLALTQHAGKDRCEYGFPAPGETERQTLVLESNKCHFIDSLNIIIKLPSGCRTGRAGVTQIYLPAIHMVSHLSSLGS